MPPFWIPHRIGQTPFDLHPQGINPDSLEEFEEPSIEINIDFKTLKSMARSLSSNLIRGLNGFVSLGQISQRRVQQVLKATPTTRVNKSIVDNSSAETQSQVLQNSSTKSQTQTFYSRISSKILNLNIGSIKNQSQSTMPQSIAASDSTDPGANNKPSAGTVTVIPEVSKPLDNYTVQGEVTAPMSRKQSIQSGGSSSSTSLPLGTTNSEASDDQNTTNTVFNSDTNNNINSILNSTSVSVSSSLLPFVPKESSMISSSSESYDGNTTAGSACISRPNSPYYSDSASSLDSFLDEKNKGKRMEKKLAKKSSKTKGNFNLIKTANSSKTLAQVVPVTHESETGTSDSITNFDQTFNFNKADNSLNNTLNHTINSTQSISFQPESRTAVSLKNQTQTETESQTRLFTTLPTPHRTSSNSAKVVPINLIDQPPICGDISAKTARSKISSEKSALSTFNEVYHDIASDLVNSVIDSEKQNLNTESSVSNCFKSPIAANKTESFPNIKSTQSSPLKEGICCICLQDLDLGTKSKNQTNGKTQRQTFPKCISCKNCFHPSCISKHLETDAERRGWGRVSCPLCRVVNNFLEPIRDDELENVLKKERIIVPYGVRRESVFRGRGDVMDNHNSDINNTVNVDVDDIESDLILNKAFLLGNLG